MRSPSRRPVADGAAGSQMRATGSSHPSPSRLRGRARRTRCGRREAGAGGHHLHRVDICRSGARVSCCSTPRARSSRSIALSRSRTSKRPTRRPYGGVGGGSGRAFAHDGFRGLVFAQPEKARLAHPAARRPLGESDLRDERGAHPVRARRQRLDRLVERAVAAVSSGSSCRAQRHSVAVSKPVPTLPA